MSITLDQLKTFCAHDGERLTINRPFSQDSWTYATDGRMIIRVPRMADVPEYDDSPKEIDARVFAAHPITGNWFKIPDGLSDKPNKCDNCKGSGKFQCDCENIHDCGKCDGSGNSPKETAIKVGSQFAGHLLLKRLTGLPNVEICNGKEKLSALGIRFDGGEGRLMPIKTE